MYNPHVVCSYQYYNSAISNDIIVDHEPDEEMSEVLYQANLLQSFYMNDFDLTEINEKINDLYRQIPLEMIEESSKKLAGRHLMCDDIFMGFMLLFSYDYFYLTHSVLSKFLLTGEKSILIIK